MSVEDTHFLHALSSLSGSKDSIRSTSALLLELLPQRTQVLLQYARAVTAFVHLQHVVFVANDALFALQTAKRQADELVAILPELLSRAAVYADDKEREKLKQLCAFWKERGIADVDTRTFDDAPPADDLFCPVGALPLLVRARGAQAPYTPLNREAVLAAPVFMPVEAAYLQSRLSRFYEELHRTPTDEADVGHAPVDAPSAFASSQRRAYDPTTNTLADGSHAGGRGGGVHSGLGVTDAGHIDDSFYESYRQARGRRYFESFR